MPKRTLESLGALVKQKRGERKLRETAKDIKIGPATLMRLENGHVPDIATFGKVCQWLGVSPNEFLGIAEEHQGSQNNRIFVSSHLRASQTGQSDTMIALAHMISLASEMQATPSEELNG